MHKNFLRIIYASSYAFQILLKTFGFWPIRFWTNFWFINTPFKKIKIDDYEFWVRGNNLLVKLADIYTVFENVIEKEYFKNSLDFSEDATIIDVGAHIGTFTICAARKAKEGKVYAFEPLPRNYEVLERNILLNNASNVLPYNLALAGSNQERILYIDDLNSGGHGFIRKSKEAVKVNCLTLTEVLIENKISKCDFLKIDCEGAEYEILLNTPIEVLKKIDQIALEYHSPEFLGLADKEIINKLLAHLKAANYQTTIKREDHRRGYIYALRK
ncbi:MAG: FkbM family methyltransferase [Patescibacteria group bacterium]